jgi:hypothetical protein
MELIAFIVRVFKEPGVELGVPIPTDPLKNVLIAVELATPVENR